MARNDAPNRIWVNKSCDATSPKHNCTFNWHGTLRDHRSEDNDIEYIRADLAAPDVPCNLGEPLMHGPQPYRWCATHNRLLLTCESAAPDAAQDEAGLNLFRQLVSGKNALRQLDVFACNSAEHDAGCECFWEQCEAWAAGNTTTGDTDAVRQARRKTWKAAIKTLENLPVVINRQGVRKGSDFNGWVSAISEGVKAFRAALRAEGEKGDENG